MRRIVLAVLATFATAQIALAEGTFCRQADGRDGARAGRICRDMPARPMPGWRDARSAYDACMNKAWRECTSLCGQNFACAANCSSLNGAACER